ncbi:MAG: basic amino acid/polyamine antiporter [Pseudomonas sp.]|uniref:basic amino acid/polyamine antiporter n=1 Tax=Pseudomonas sp. TaxID=306 RepID=UPI0030F02912
MTDGATPKPSAKLGLFLLSGVVIGSMIGGGGFNLPQNMSAHASLGAIAIAWVLTLVGMFFLANCFRLLSTQRPELTAGVYAYAREGFGNLAGFQVAWGYWLSAAFGNVAFAVLIMKSLGYLFPAFADGKNWLSIGGASLLIWVMHFTVLFGVRRAAVLGSIASVLNVGSLLVTIAIMALMVKAEMFRLDLWGVGENLGSVMKQVESTMLVTLWVFIGIEGAVVMSARARKPEQVGQATYIGLLVCTLLYFLLSALPFGFMTQPELAALDEPAAAYILERLVGRWGAIFVIVSLLVSLLSCWLAWTILVAELPFAAAKDGVFPRFLARENRFHSPGPALWLSSAVMQVIVFVVLFAENAWIWLISVTGVMILPAYLASTAYLWRYALSHAYMEERGRALRSGVLGSVYALWLLYAAGPQFLLMSSLLFVAGLPVFYFAHRQNLPHAPLFSRTEGVAAGALVVVAGIALWAFFTGLVELG